MKMKNCSKINILTNLILIFAIALLVSSDFGFLLGIILLGVLINTAFVLACILKNLLKIPKLTIENNKLIYNGSLIPKKFDLESTVISLNSDLGSPYYHIISNYNTATIRENILNETEKKILRELDYIRNESILSEV
jgi:hypothetical protein